MSRKGRGRHRCIRRNQGAPIVGCIAVLGSFTLLRFCVPDKYNSTTITAL